MANTVIGASVQVEFSSVGNMRKALKEANQELLAMQDKFGAASSQAIDAARKVAELKDRIEDARETADLFDPGKKFQAFVTLGSQIAAGFSAVQGAMALVGAESEDVQKALLKVQGAMALAQGLSQLKDFGKSWQQLKVVINSATQGLNGFKKALVSSGIGLLVVSVGLLVAYWDDIKRLVTGVSKEQEKLVIDAKEKATAAERELDILERSGETLKASGKTEKEIIQAKLTQLATIIQQKQIELAGIKANRDATIAQTKRYYEMIKAAARVGMEVTTAALRALAVPVQILIETVNSASEVLGFGKVITLDLQSEISKMNEFAASSVANLAFDPNKTKDDIDKSITDLEDGIINAKEKQANYNKSLVADNKNKNEKISTQDKQAAEEDRKRKEEADKEAAAKRRDLALKRDKEFTEEINNIIEETRLAGIKDLREKERAELEATHREQLLDIKNNENATFEQRLALTIALRQKQRQEELALQQKFDQEDLQKESAKLLEQSNAEDLNFAERLAKIKEREDLESQIIFESDQARTDFQKQNSEARKKIAQEEKNAIIQALDAVAQSLLNASDLLGKNTKAGKALAIASATISMLTSAQKAYEATVGIPFVGPVLAPINAGLAIAAGIKNIREIAKVKVPGGGGGGGVPNPPTPPPGTAPMQPGLSPAVQGQALNAQAINDLGNQSLRAYVMNSDIQNNNQRNAYLERNARIG
jgi:hypothetical protein